MKTYSKGKLKLKRAMMALVFLFVALLIAGLVLLFAFCLKDNIEICEEKNDAVNVSDDVAANSQPIIIDNLVVGATYNTRWVSANKYYLKSNFKSDVELSVYNGIVAELFEISKTVFECVLISVCPILFWISFIKLLQLFIEKEFSISSIPKITF